MNEDKKASECLKEYPKIREALDENKKANSRELDPLKTVATKNSPSIWLFLVLFVAAAALYFFIGSSVFTLENHYVPLLKNIAAGFALTMVLLIINQLLRAYLVNKVDNPAICYNLRRIADLAVGLLILFIALSIIFSNWYTVVVSLGLISLILGLALQNPITSFLAGSIFSSESPTGWAIV